MENCIHLVVYALETSRVMLESHLADLTAGEWNHRAAPKGNCPAWLVGHLILTERRALSAVGQQDLPALPEGFDTRFSREHEAPAAADFGDPSPLLPLFNAHRRLLIDTVKRMNPEQLQSPPPRPSPRFSNLGEYLTFMGFHVLIHTGQISTIRRSLGRPPLN